MSYLLFLGVHINCRFSRVLLGCQQLRWHFNFSHAGYSIYVSFFEKFIVQLFKQFKKMETIFNCVHALPSEKSGTRIFLLWFFICRIQTITEAFFALIKVVFFYVKPSVILVIQKRGLSLLSADVTWSVFSGTYRCMQAVTILVPPKLCNKVISTGWIYVPRWVHSSVSLIY